MIFKFVLVMVSAIMADICWTKYMLGVSEKAPFKAAFWSAMIIAIGGFMVISYTQNHLLVVAAMLGAFIGTFLAVYREKQK